MEKHQDQYDVLSRKIKGSFRRGVILLMTTVWFIPGLLYRFLGLSPPSEDNFIDQIFRVSYLISPEVTSMPEILSISKQDQSFLTSGNLLGALLILLIIWGGLSISAGWDYLIKKDVLREEVKDEDIKAGIRRRNNRK